MRQKSIIIISAAVLFLALLAAVLLWRHYSSLNKVSRTPAPTPSVSLLPSPTPFPTRIPLGNVYENAAFGFSVRYPEKWRTVVRNNQDIGFEAPETPGIDAFRIRVLPNPGRIDLAEYLRKRENLGIKDIFANRSYAKTVTVDSRYALRFGRLGSDLARVYVAKDLNIFRISAVCCVSPENESVFDEFMRSFQFLR